MTLVPTYPLESDEQAAFIAYLDLRQLKYTAVPNSTYTTSWKVKVRNTDQGVRRGFPDMVVLIPPHRSKDGIGHLLAVEMKRQRGSTASPEQLAWIDAINDLNTPSVMACVAKGADAAIEAVESLLEVAA